MTSIEGNSYQRSIDKNYDNLSIYDMIKLIFK